MGSIGADDCQGAIEDFTQVIKINPRDTVPFLYRGEVYTTIENYESAISDLNQVIKIDPSCVDGYFSRGYVLNQKGDKRGALLNTIKSLN